MTKKLFIHAHLNLNFSNPTILAKIFKSQRVLWNCQVNKLQGTKKLCGFIKITNEKVNLLFLLIALSITLSLFLNFVNK